MGKGLWVAGLLFPLTAHAGPSAIGTVVPAPPARTYDALAPPPIGGAPSGWGFHATLRGRSVDLAARDLGWAPDPAAHPGDAEAGFGWRGHAASALVGYGQYDLGPHYDPRARTSQPFARQPAHSGVMGLSFLLHMR